MGDPFKKVQRGEPLRIPAETFNTFIDAAKDFRQRTQNRGQSSLANFADSGIVLVKNASGGDRDRYDILGIDSPKFATNTLRWFPVAAADRDLFAVDYRSYAIDVTKSF